MKNVLITCCAAVLLFGCVKKASEENRENSFSLNGCTQGYEQTQIGNNQYCCQRDENEDIASCESTIRPVISGSTCENDGATTWTRINHEEKLGKCKGSDCKGNPTDAWFIYATKNVYRLDKCTCTGMSGSRKCTWGGGGCTLTKTCVAPCKAETKKCKPSGSESIPGLGEFKCSESSSGENCPGSRTAIRKEVSSKPSETPEDLLELQEDLDIYNQQLQEEKAAAGKLDQP